MFLVVYYLGCESIYLLYRASQNFILYRKAFPNLFNKGLHDKFAKFFLHFPFNRTLCNSLKPC